MKDNTERVSYSIPPSRGTPCFFVPPLPQTGKGFYEKKLKKQEKKQTFNLEQAKIV